MIAQEHTATLLVLLLQVEVHGSEDALLDAVVGAVRALDPDILVGYEVQQGSLGYLNDRATALQRSEPLLRQLSRTPQVQAALFLLLALLLTYALAIMCVG